MFHIMWPMSMTRALVSPNPSGMLTHLAVDKDIPIPPLDRWESVDEFRVDLGGMMHLDEPFHRVTLRGCTYEVRELNLSSVIDCLSVDDNGWSRIPVHPFFILYLGGEDRTALLEWAKEMQYKHLDSILATDTKIRQAQAEGGIITQQYLENPDAE